LPPIAAGKSRKSVKRKTLKKEYKFGKGIKKYDYYIICKKKKTLKK
jgi:hypothetical protein